MNSCGNSNIGTKLRGSKSSEIQEDPVGSRQAESSEKEDSDILGGYSSNDFSIPRGTLVICQRNSNNYSSDHSFSRFKPRYVVHISNVVTLDTVVKYLKIILIVLVKKIVVVKFISLFIRTGGGPRNEFRMARGGGSGDRGRGGTRGRAFKKTPIGDRDSTNAEPGYHLPSRPKFQESLKNHENSQSKYYDDKRTNGEYLFLKATYNNFLSSEATIIAFYLFQRILEYLSF